MEHDNRLTYLLDRLATHTATAAELDELTALVDLDQPGASVNEAESWLEEHYPVSPPPYDPQHWTQVANQILMSDKLAAESEIKPAARVHFLHRWGWAAAVVLVLGAAAWFISHHHRKPPAAIVAGNAQPDADPGKNGAILTLADGSRMVLDSAGNGLITRQNGTTVVLKNNALQYTPESTGAGEMEYNTITTPKGRQFQVVLPDGTKVWLNAASALQFPVAFNGADRVVELSGEAYFDVSKNARQPFKVKVLKKMEIEVLGTGFNVNAYTNELHTYTTLVEGAVRVSLANGGSTVLKPGDQLKASNTGMQVSRNADMEKAIAWKNGLFNFEGVSLKEMMRQLERWYNLEVVYEGNVPDVKFFGEMSRSLKLSDVLTGLERSDVHFRLEEGRRLIVMP